MMDELQQSICGSQHQMFSITAVYEPRFLKTRGQTLKCVAVRRPHDKTNNKLNEPAYKDENEVKLGRKMLRYSSKTNQRAEKSCIQGAQNVSAKLFL